jgi:hypothetical protein
MSFFDSLANVATGGLGKVILDGIKDYFPPDMTPEQKANIALAAQQIELQKTIEFSRAQQEAEKDLNARIEMYEGTASDLKSLPLVGPIMLFLRGAQRPIWGYATIYLDYGVFSGMWKLTDPIVSNAFWVVNFLVLGFLFGERAVMNVMPFVTDMLKAKNSSSASSISTVERN